MSLNFFFFFLQKKDKFRIQAINALADWIAIDPTQSADVAKAEVVATSPSEITSPLPPTTSPSFGPAVQEKIALATLISAVIGSRAPFPQASEIESTVEKLSQMCKEASGEAKAKGKDGDEKVKTLLLALSTTVSSLSLLVDVLDLATEAKKNLSDSDLDSSYDSDSDEDSISDDSDD